jgi:cytochrome c-type biogenesis protein CcmH
VHGLLARRSSWLVLGALVVALLSFGSVHPPPESRAARVQALESIIKCPVCNDVSIAQSDAAVARALRAKVVELVDSGRSNAEIERYVVGQFGPSELLRPQNPLVWLLPAALLGVATAGLAVVLIRRRRLQAVAAGLPEDEALVAAALARRSAEARS